MNDQSLHNHDEAEVTYSFGQRLSSARRALNLTQEQVAAELRLKVDLIQALEEEDYSRLPTHMYIAGYLRNYARVLKIPVEPLLAALEKAKLETPPLISDASHPRKTSHNKLFGTLFVVAILLVVVAGIVSWMQSQDFSWFSSASHDNVQPTVATSQLPVPVVKEFVEEQPVTEVIPEAAPIVEEVVQVEVVKPQEKAPEVTEVKEVVVKEEPVLFAQPEVITEGVELALHFTGDCWTEVVDSRGQRLAYDLYRDGQHKQVKGMPPFNIFLGNAAAVSVEYNGQAYDISEHVRGNLARFNLGRADDDKSTTE